jgi:hypothetical protein
MHSQKPKASLQGCRQTLGLKKIEITAKERQKKRRQKHCKNEALRRRHNKPVYNSF